MEIIQRMLKNSLDLYKYLPVFLSLGRTCTMSKVTGPELKELSGVLNRAGDDRQGQLVRNYDRFFLSIASLITKYGIDPPQVFASGEIDRTALLHYSTDKKVILG